MTNKQWLRRFIHRLRDPEFTGNVEWHMRAIRAAAAAGDVSTRQSCAAHYRAFLAADRGEVRATLTRAIIDELGIVTTQHVGAYIMRTCFRMGMGCDLLDHYFAVPGRDASVKYMRPARRALASRPDLALRYAALYRWYCKAQAKQAQRLKGSSRQAQQRLQERIDARFQLAPQVQATQDATVSLIPKQERFSRQLPLFGI